MTEQNKEWTLDLPLSKQGNSLGVSIPRKILNQLGINHGDRVRVILYPKEQAD